MISLTEVNRNIYYLYSLPLSSMAETNATILIPDISGFTEFMTKTELDHGSRAINFLLDSILKATGDEYEISEIEGDAVLMYKRGPAPSKKEIQDFCLRVFHAFHFQKKWMQLHNVCPCNSCLAVVDLTLKFVVHHGPVGEMKVGRFVTLSGTDMIIAHRLLKNSVPSNEYLLMTEKLWENPADPADSADLQWNSLSDEFASVGKINYRFALLDEIRKNAPDPPGPDNSYPTDNSPFLEVIIAANFRDIYMVMMDIPGRAAWWPGLQKVNQDIPAVFIGSVHHCDFENYTAIISPLQMTLSEGGIVFAETCRIPEMNLSLVYEYLFNRVDQTSSSFACRILNATDTPVPEDLNALFFNALKQVAEKLKYYCETMELSFF